MLTNLKLYGTEDVPKIPKEIVDVRLELLNKHLDKLLSVHFMEQDNNTISEVLKAKAHWAKLRDGEDVTL